MQLAEFTTQVKDFASLTHLDKTLHFMWFLHVHADKERVQQRDVRACYVVRNEEPPNLSTVFVRMLGKRPKLILQDSRGYYIEHKQRSSLDSKYGQHQTTIAVSKLLRDLPVKISDEAERIFLREAITCYNNKAYRAAIIMAWNLTYDHMARWIIADTARLATFNTHIAGRLGANSKRAGTKIIRREDFEKLEEKEMIDIMANASLLPSSNSKKILEIQLTRRNMAAHPSLVAIEAPQADDAISSLVADLILKLA